MDFDDTCAGFLPAKRHRSKAARIAHERRKQGLIGIRGGGVIAVRKENASPWPTTDGGV